MTDGDGNATTTVIPKPVRGPTGISVPDGKGGYKPYNPPKEPEGGTFYDPETGRTTTGVFNKDGSITRTVTDGDGKATTTVIPKPDAGPTGISVPDGKGGYKPFNPPKEPEGGTIYDPETGRTTTGVFNKDGSITRTVTDVTARPRRPSFQAAFCSDDR